MEPLTITLLGTVALVGGALLWAILADRRRQGLQQRFKAVVTGSPSAMDGLAALPSLRRPTPSRAVGSLAGQAAQWLAAEFAAAGNSVGMVHLVVAGCISLIIIYGFTNRLLALNAAAAGLAGTVAAMVFALLMLRLAQSRYRNRFLEAFPDALDLISRAVKAGLPVMESMAVASREIADPVGAELRRTLEEAKIGIEPHQALQDTANRIRIPDFRFFVVTIGLQRRTGGSLAETLGNLSAVIRARRTMRLKARALSAETKASAFVLASLPLLVGGLMYLNDPTLMSVLFFDPRGQVMLGISCTTLVIGIATMAMIIRRTLR